jgi:hypothetical protein
MFVTPLPHLILPPLAEFEVPSGVQGIVLALGTDAVGECLEWI